MTDILDKYEFTEINGDPLPDFVIDILKNPPSEFGFSLDSEGFGIDYMYDNVRDILEQTELTKGDITILQSMKIACNQRVYSVDGGDIQPLDSSGLMEEYDVIYFKLKK